MEQIIYHGSRNIIDHPRFGVGKPYNDYGLAFYCTEHPDMACEWAVGHGGDGYINKYRLDVDSLRVLNLNSEEFCTLHWLAVLLQNRVFDLRAPLAVEARGYLLSHFNVDFESVDVIKGYRADDSYFAFAQDFLSGSISYQQLQRAMKLGKLGEQIAIKSEEAFRQLHFESASKAPAKEWLARRQKRDLSARQRYFDVERNARSKGDIYITQILDEEMEPGDARL